MVSSGVPQTGNERHAEDIAHMAMLILVTMAKPTLPLLLLHRLQLRIGIHTGTSSHRNKSI
jgi:class 3 adenylate cyclase